MSYQTNCNVYEMKVADFLFMECSITRKTISSIKYVLIYMGIYLYMG